MNGRVVMSQLGARMHYAVSRILEENGELERLYTDICATKSWPRLLALAPKASLPQSVRRLAGRVPVGIPSARITSFPAMGCYYVARRMGAKTPGEETRVSLLAASDFSRRVVRQGFGEASGFYGISGECLEQIRAAKAAGLWAAVEQIIAPRAVVDRLVAEQAARFPDWEGAAPDDPYAARFAAREMEEWAAADLVICPSEFVRRGVVAVGGPAHKCVVVPYGIDLLRFRVPPRDTSPKLRVLTVGAVGLRKGSPYVLEAARRLAGRAEFRMIGAIGVPNAVERDLREALDLRGVVARAEIAAHFAWADVFLLPSICEGSATVTYEALAAGLPVVTTPNAGSVVRHGVDGIVAPVGEAEGIVAALDRLCWDRGRLAAMSTAAVERASSFDLAAYGARLRAALAPLRQSPNLPDVNNLARTL